MKEKFIASAADLPWEPRHPGYYVKKDILEPTGLTQEGLGKRLNVSRGSINELVRGKRDLTIDMARRISELTGQSEEYWISLQKQYELWQSRHATPSFGIKPLDMNLEGSEIVPV